MRDRTGESIAGRGPGARSELNSGGARSIDRRSLLKFAGATLALLISPVGYAAPPSLLAVRVWPSPEYTRITLEGSANLRYSHMLVQDPDRLVVDLEGVQLDSVLQSLPSKVMETDPYIRLIRAGQNRPGVVRVVVELKTPINVVMGYLQLLQENVYGDLNERQREIVTTLEPGAYGLDPTELYLG